MSPSYAAVPRQLLLVPMGVMGLQTLTAGLYTSPVDKSFDPSYLERIRKTFVRKCMFILRQDSFIKLSLIHRSSQFRCRLTWLTLPKMPTLSTNKTQYQTTVPSCFTSMGQRIGSFLTKNRRLCQFVMATG